MAPPKTINPLARTTPPHKVVDVSKLAKTYPTAGLTNAHPAGVSAGAHKHEAESGCGCRTPGSKLLLVKKGPDCECSSNKLLDRSSFAIRPGGSTSVARHLSTATFRKPLQHRARPLTRKLGKIVPAEIDFTGYSGCPTFVGYTAAQRACLEQAWMRANDRPPAGRPAEYCNCIVGRFRDDFDSRPPAGGRPAASMSSSQN